MNRVSALKKLGVSDETLILLNAHRGNLFHVVRGLGDELLYTWEQLLQEKDDLKIARLNIRTESLLLDMEIIKMQAAIEKSIEKGLEIGKEFPNHDIRKDIDNILGMDQRHIRWKEILPVPETPNQHKITNFTKKENEIDLETDPEIEIDPF